MNLYQKQFKFLIAPALILFTLVIVIPFIMGITYSFTSWRGTYFATGDSAFSAFVGFDNYVNIFKNDDFMNAFVYTVEYTMLAVVFIVGAGLGLALLVTKISKATGLYRTVFFLPNLMGGLVLGFIWQFIFEIIFTNIIFKEGGLLDIEFFRYMLQDRQQALIALVIMTTWQFAGYMMIIFVAALNNVPVDLYEASNIDGASSRQQFRSVTLPMIMPAFTITLFLTLSNSFKLLDQNVALTDGAFDTRLLAMQIWRVTKDTAPPDYGLAQAQAVIFFIIVASISVTQVYITKKREVEL